MRILGRFLLGSRGTRKSPAEAAESAERQIPKDPTFGLDEREADLSSRKAQRPRTSAERALTAQGFTIKQYGGRGHQVAERDATKNWYYDHLEPGMNGPCRILVKDGKPLNAAGERLLESYKKSAK